jgi:hypothetical protein
MEENGIWFLYIFTAKCGVYNSITSLDEWNSVPPPGEEELEVLVRRGTCEWEGIMTSVDC